jgi:hypothetical protein
MTRQGLLPNLRMPIYLVIRAFTISMQAAVAPFVRAVVSNRFPSPRVHGGPHAGTHCDIWAGV